MWISKSYNPGKSPAYVYEWKQPVEKGTYVINFILSPVTQSKTILLTAYNSSSGSGQSFNKFPETIDTVFLKDGTLTLTLSLDDNNFEFPIPQFFRVVSTQTFTQNGLVTSQNVLKKYEKSKSCEEVHSCGEHHSECSEEVNPVVQSKEGALQINCLLIYKKLEFISSLLDLINKAMLPEVIVNIQLSVKEEISVYIKEMKEHYDFLRDFLSVTPCDVMPSSSIVTALLDPRFDNWMQTIFNVSKTLEILQEQPFVFLVHNTYTYICTLMSRLSSVILKIKKC
jgi:hypothetical protein